MIENRLPCDRALRALGLSATDAIARGMEATCFPRDDQTIVKVYDGPAHTSCETLLRLQLFYSSLDASNCRLQLPAIEEVRIIDEIPVTIERRLPGGNMLDVIKEASTVRLEHWLDENLNALEQLRQVKPAAALRDLRPITGCASRAAPEVDWFNCIRTVVAQEAARLSDHLSRDVRDLTGKVLRFDKLLDRRLDEPLRLVHGDFGPFNLLIDSHHRVTAVIDFGLFTFWGDWRFDWAIAWKIFDMYDSMKLRATDRYRDLILERIGHEQLPTLSLYLLVYSLIAADAYDRTCSDGHFRWCVANLNDCDLWKDASDS